MLNRQTALMLDRRRACGARRGQLVVHAADAEHGTAALHPYYAGQTDCRRPLALADTFTLAFVKGQSVSDVSQNVTCWCTSATTRVADAPAAGRLSS